MAPKLNRWGEPTGPDVIERGDRVQVIGGTTAGVVIAVTTSKFIVTGVTISMDKPQGWIQNWGPNQLKITMKAVL